LPTGRRIEWSPAAERDVEEAIDYLWPLSEVAVERLAQLFDAATARLTDFPERGTTETVPGVPPGARSVLVERYRLVYLPSDEQILVLAVWAPKRDRPSR
jgi:plasmid stabilization system protein ParE